MKIYKFSLLIRDKTPSLLMMVKECLSPIVRGCPKHFVAGWIAGVVASCVAMSTQAQLGSSTSGGRDSGGSGGCVCACPQPQIGCPYCGNTSSTTEGVESIGWIPGYGNVIGRACSDWGVVRAAALAQPTNTVLGMRFSGSASFTDFVVPTLPGLTGVMRGFVNVTFIVSGSRSGFTLATGEYSVSSSLGGIHTNYSSLPLEETRTVLVPIQIGQGNGFSLHSSLELTAGNCSAPLQGGTVDYYSGKSGIRILQLGFTDTNGVPLANVRAIGTDSGVTYRVGPEISIGSPTNGSMQIQICGFPGSNYVTEAATILSMFPTPTAWAPINTNAADINGLIRFTLSDMSEFPRRVFRARMQ